MLAGEEESHMRIVIALGGNAALGPASSPGPPART